MADDLYDFEVLHWAASITRIGDLPDPSARVTRESRVCGSRVTVSVSVHNDCVSDYAQKVEACALGQAVAAIIADRVIGQSLAQIRAARDGLFAMIKARSPAPGGHWAPLAALEPAADIPTRHASVLLPFDALIAALEAAGAAAVAAPAQTGV